MTKNALIAILIAALVASVTTLIVRAQSDSAAVEVRVSAREHTDGRIEIALQQRDGVLWGDRILPVDRIFPETRDQEVWYNTTPITFEPATPPTDDAPQDARQESSAPSTDSAESADDNEISGTGPGVVRTTLSAGTYIVSITVSGNVDGGLEDNFIIVAIDQAGTEELLANEIIRNWDSARVLNVGGGLFELEPGRILFEIDCAPGAQWTLSFE